MKVQINNGQRRGKSSERNVRGDDMRHGPWIREGSRNAPMGWDTVGSYHSFKAVLEAIISVVKKKKKRGLRLTWRGIAITVCIHVESWLMGCKVTL
ncbi:hypothetical protein DM02DRAFT_238342 [Periconia macrospinosa]|uniref:Uncharacterized protein n=1 Tax=Periconia macrospinosa TaxID=97972 RepID=A0A2V1ECD6_9PLEO|nr:hypothetical protein DM02DRAFT_238342 [Periconia macrospinosa]